MSQLSPEQMAALVEMMEQAAARMMDQKLTEMLARDRGRCLRRIMEAPTNYHQATMYYCFSEGVPLLTKLRFQLGGWAIVLFQLWVLGAVLMGASTPSCTSNRQCPNERICVPMAYSRIFGGLASFRQGVCSNCGDNQHGVRAFLSDQFPHAGAANFSCPQQGDYHEQCASCYDTAAHQWKDYTHQDEITELVSGMAPRDWAATLLASVVIGGGVVRELRDIKLCRLSCTGLLQLPDAQPQTLRNLWNALAQLMAIIRRFSILPMVVHAAMELVVARGADALSICLNTLAVLFLLECDNLAYEVGLNDDTRCTVDNYGRAEVDEAAAALLTWMKTAHLLGVVVCLPVAVALRSHANTYYLGVWLPSLLFTAIAMLEVLLEMGNQPVRRRCLALAAAVGKGLFGWTVYVVFMLFS